MSNKLTLAQQAFEQGRGILRLAPNWVPRTFCVPGRRLKLYPDDYYALGNERGGIDERWFSSTIPADNGPQAPADEGLSEVVFEYNGSTERIFFRDAVQELKGQLVGERIWDEHASWPMLSKFFDYKGALPHHVHLQDEHARLTGQNGKPEAYYFPPQMNNYPGDFPYTFFGLNPGTTKEQVKECLLNFSRGDNKITNLSRAQKLELGTGWNTPPGLLHAPGSLCTYEPQKASDVLGMYQSQVGDEMVSEDLLWKDVPDEHMGNYDFLVEILDWELNVDPHLLEKSFMPPVPVRPVDEMQADGYIENWICYKSEAFSARELTVLPGRSVVIEDAAAYGLIMTQGHGTMGQAEWPIETPSMIRFGELTHDEYFVSEQAAREGVTINNHSETEPLVMLKHFGPGNPDLNIE